MIQVRIKRVYEDFSETDGYRVLVDKLWPRGMKKEWLKYDYWQKTSHRLPHCVDGFTKIFPDTGKTSSYSIRKNLTLLPQWLIF